MASKGWICRPTADRCRASRCDRRHRLFFNLRWRRCRLRTNGACLIQQLVQCGGNLRVVEMLLFDASQCFLCLLWVAAGDVQLQLGELPSGRRFTGRSASLARLFDQSQCPIRIVLRRDQSLICFIGRDAAGQ
jgi:hypothetical protein